MFLRNPFSECVWLGWATKNMFSIGLEVESETMVAHTGKHCCYLLAYFIGTRQQPPSWGSIRKIQNFSTAIEHIPLMLLHYKYSCVSFLLVFAYFAHIMFLPPAASAPFLFSVSASLTTPLLGASTFRSVG